MVYEMEVVGSQATILAFVDQHEIGARGIVGKTSLRESVPDHAGRIRGEEPKIIVFNDGVPRWGKIVYAHGQHEPSQDNASRMAAYETRYEREH